jgi:hypothetical protein
MPTPHRRTKGRKRCTEQRDIRYRHTSRVCRAASSTALADRCHRAQSSSTAAAHRAHGLQGLISRYFESRLTCQLRSPLLRRRCAIEPGVPLLKQLMKRTRRRPCQPSSTNPCTCPCNCHNRDSISALPDDNCDDTPCKSADVTLISAIPNHSNPRYRPNTPKQAVYLDRRATPQFMTKPATCSTAQFEQRRPVVRAGHAATLR